jgi:pentatricopeptide repeat protein
MLNKGLKPDTLAYNFLIYGCCIAGELGKAFELRDDMIRRGVKPNQATHKSLSHGASRKFSISTHPVMPEN